MRVDSGYMYIRTPRCEDPKRYYKYSGMTVKWCVDKSGLVTYATSVCDKVDKFSKHIGKKLVDDKFTHIEKNNKNNQIHIRQLMKKHLNDIINTLSENSKINLDERTNEECLDLIKFDEFIEHFRKYMTKHYTKNYKKHLIKFKQLKFKELQGKLSTQIASYTEREFNEIQNIKEFMDDMHIIYLSKPRNKRILVLKNMQPI